MCGLRVDSVTTMTAMTVCEVYPLSRHRICLCYESFTFAKGGRFGYNKPFGRISPTDPFRSVERGSGPQLAVLAFFRVVARRDDGPELARGVLLPLQVGVGVGCESLLALMSRHAPSSARVDAAVAAEQGCIGMP